MLGAGANGCSVRAKGTGGQVRFHDLSQRVRQMGPPSKVQWREQSSKRSRLPRVYRAKVNDNHWAFLAANGIYGKEDVAVPASSGAILSYSSLRAVTNALFILPMLSLSM